MNAARGSDGVRPFQFSCQRSGNCCSGGAGYVWIDAREIAPMAAALGQSNESFTAEHVRRVNDPRTGEERLSLRERSGAGPSGAACALLEGVRQCRVYDVRPQHCRAFPFWPSILSDESAFERARSTCPGITVLPVAEVRAAAFQAVQALYDELDATIASHRPLCTQRGTCCRFEDAGHELFATALESDYAAHCHPAAPAPEAPGRCPYHVAGACTAREGRPIGCRTYFCDPRTESALQEVHEDFLARLRRIERECGFPAAYGRFPAMLAGRGVGVSDQVGMNELEEGNE